MRVLVTGAQGIIASQVVASLIADDHAVVCAVRGACIDERFAGLHSIAMRHGGRRARRRLAQTSVVSYRPEACAHAPPCSWRTG